MEKNDKENILDDGLVSYQTFFFSFSVFYGTRMYWQHTCLHFMMIIAQSGLSFYFMKGVVLPTPNCSYILVRKLSL